jgi:uncharacterized protein with GYD domain
VTRVPTYIMLTTLTHEGSKTLTTQPDRVRAVNEELREYGCRVVAQYATLGPYDFVNIVDAPDNESIAVLSAALAARGSITMLTMPAVSVGDLLGRLKSAPQP